VFDSVTAATPGLFRRYCSGKRFKPVTALTLAEQWRHQRRGGHSLHCGTAGAVPPAINIPSNSHNGILGSTVQFSASVGGTAPLAFQVAKGDGVTFTNLTDGATSLDRQRQTCPSAVCPLLTGCIPIVRDHSVGSVISPSPPRRCVHATDVHISWRSVRCTMVLLP